MYAQLFDNENNLLSQVFQTNKTDCDAPTSSFLTKMESHDPNETISVEDKIEKVDFAINLSKQSLPTFEKFSDSKCENEENYLSEGRESILKSIMSPSTFKQLLEGVRDIISPTKDPDWTFDPTNNANDPCTENEQISTSNTMEMLNNKCIIVPDSDDTFCKMDTLESAFIGFNNQLAYLTKADSQPVLASFESKLSDKILQYKNIIKMPAGSDVQAGKIKSKLKYPLKTVKSVPAFVNPSFMFDRGLSNETSIRTQNLDVVDVDDKNDDQVMIKSCSTSFAESNITTLSEDTPNFNWSSLRDLSIPLEKVLAELDQTLQPFISKEKEESSMNSSLETSPTLNSLMKRCPSYNNILTHASLFEEHALVKESEHSASTSDVDSTFAEVTATLQETTSELETLKFDLENNKKWFQKSLQDKKVDEQKYDDIVSIVKCDVPEKTELSPLNSDVEPAVNNLNQSSETCFLTDTPENENIINSQETNSTEIENAKMKKKKQHLAPVSPVKLNLEDKPNANIDDETNEVKLTKSKSELMRLFSMSRHRDMSPEPIFLEGLKSPCLIEPEMDEVHFLSDEDLREIDLDEDIPPKHLLKNLNKKQSSANAEVKNNEIHYYQFPSTYQNYHSGSKYYADVEKNNSMGNGDKMAKSEAAEKQIKPQSKSLDLKIKPFNQMKTITNSLDERKLTHSDKAKSHLESERDTDDKIAYSETMLEKFIDITSSLFRQATGKLEPEIPPSLHRRHSSLWKETKRKYNSLDENVTLTKSDSAKSKSGWSVKSYSLDSPAADYHVNQMNKDDEHFWKHVKEIDQRPSHLFGFVPRGDDDAYSVDKSTTSVVDDLLRNTSSRSYLTEEDDLQTKIINESFQNIQELMKIADVKTSSTYISECLSDANAAAGESNANANKVMQRNDSDDGEVVDIFGIKISKSKHYLHQRIKDEIKIVTATKRLRIDEAEEIRMMEAVMAEREKIRKIKEYPPAPNNYREVKNNQLDYRYDYTSEDTEPIEPNIQETFEEEYIDDECIDDVLLAKSKLSEDFQNILNDISDLPLLIDKKHSRASSASSYTGSSTSVEAYEAPKNYTERGNRKWYFNTAGNRNRNRSESSNSCFSDSFVKNKPRQGKLESRSSQMIYPVEDDQVAVAEAYSNVAPTSISYSLPGSRSSSMSRSINSNFSSDYDCFYNVNNDNYHDNFDYYQKYDPDYEYLCRLEKEEQMKQEKLNRLRVEIEKRRKHLLVMTPTQPAHASNSAWQTWNQPQNYWQSELNHRQQMEWLRRDDYMEKKMHIDENSGIIKPIDYQISRQRPLTYNRFNSEHDFHSKNLLIQQQRQQQQQQLLQQQKYFPDYYAQMYYQQPNTEPQYLHASPKKSSSDQRLTPINLTDLLGISDVQRALANSQSGSPLNRKSYSSPTKNIIHPIQTRETSRQNPYHTLAQTYRQYHQPTKFNQTSDSRHYYRATQSNQTETSESEESLLHYCLPTHGSSRDSGVSSNGMMAEVPAQNDQLPTTRSRSGDLFAMQNSSPAPHYATYRKKVASNLCRMGLNVLNEKKYPKQTNSAAALKCYNTGPQLEQGCAAARDEQNTEMNRRLLCEQATPLERGFARSPSD
ncbi:hypothetical protein HELRODRAFT_161832 [Helobdella robusta]|uniref:Uncharacterized protein n=1 Tax=Helobdella robusta TaxID=6412 RepID=T1ERY5_HELRO|nr:hypothetical protein HELRODRAFT_161832 [Helobdella robusta]ESO02551.1 hypothetical protein HELRODRAFT_161832 [Helobdella robusta]